ncbi:2-C-methyl-D-erythritol 4-phosphate cytidylyltransferase [Phosphitispora sp. TUW77]|uniref:2-C-methyl-D-erythritol 4-phosphate cytidylyltransferase n=1 Tax=Phosphitispora sp. TUW77 TaxID=3152361 RepID=UPI003AB89400
MDKFTAIIPAAGQGRRMKSYLNKQFILLKGMPIIVHTLRVFQDAGIISDIVLVCASGEEEYYRQDILSNYGISKPTVVVAGGSERQDSVYCGLEAIDDSSDYIMIHDGARPLLPINLINRLAEEVKITGAVVAGVPVSDTIKRTDAGGIIIDTVMRKRLWSIQTPQVFRLDLIKKAHKLAKAAEFMGTDDATLVERLGVPVKVIPGSYENIKITTPEDIVVAEAILKRRGIG